MGYVRYFSITSESFRTLVNESNLSLSSTLDQTIQTLKSIKQRSRMSLSNRSHGKRFRKKKISDSELNRNGTNQSDISDQNESPEHLNNSIERLPSKKSKRSRDRIVFAAPENAGQPIIAIKMPVNDYDEQNETQTALQIDRPDSSKILPTNKNRLSQREKWRNQLLSLSNFEIVWRNLRYYPPKVCVAESEKSKKRLNVRRTRTLNRPILNNICGSISSGQMTGIMGPSGSGKTILLNCLAGFLDIDCRAENSGEIMINGLNSARIGFVEQFDHLLSYLTVWETVLFASRIRNAARYYLNHRKVTRNVLNRLNLLEKKDHYVSRCSNGERKRISIAIELVFNYDILMLDEPTTGLDSVTSYSIISILKSLSEKRKSMTVLMSIHQPSNRIFSLFDNLIVLSNEGTIIFQGPPSNLTQTLQLVGLTCPMYTSISDFILEVSSGDFGRQSLHLLAHYHNEYNRNRLDEDYNEFEMVSLKEAIKNAHLNDQRSSLLCIWLVFNRNLLNTSRNRFALKIRIPALIMIGLMLSAIYTDSIGSISTCTTKFLFWSSKLENLIETIENDNARSKENVCLIFMILLMVMFNSMLNLVVTVAEEIHVFRREYNNHSFTVTTYFIAKNLSEFFFTVFSSAGFVWLVHR
ncbi:ATP-binding cassette sub-family G member 1 [Sarcoptes scabiei]|uniref:ATP-binding cassette sub-family G member 1 n=1 Tax=Sarcoptes scabiei TaxID=52283 RepID=A0A834VEU1_SARSC|nr:ATP-binding cassette sub-family G member 1 [Sarcoptes scabiei]